MEELTPRNRGTGADAGASLDVDALLQSLGPRLTIEKQQLVLYSRAARGNHPCTWLGGFDTADQMANSAKMAWPLKGANGWSSLREMLEATVDQARAHGISGLGLIEGITDNVWRFWSADRVQVAMLAGHPLNRYIDMSQDALEMATPNSPQGRVIAHLRAHQGGTVAGIELPSTGAPAQLPPGVRIRHRERHLLVFPDRVKLHDEKLGPWDEVIPIRLS